MPNNTVPAAGEAMPRNNAILQCTDDVALAKSIVSSVWLALASQNFTEGDANDLRETLYGAVLKLHSATTTLSGSTPAEISAALDIEAAFPATPAVPDHPASTVFPVGALKSELLDIENMVDAGRDLVEAVFMAAHAVGERRHTSAIHSICEIAEKHFIAVGHRLEEIREAL